MPSIFDEFRQLIDEGRLEAPLQDFLQIHPEILAHTFNQGAHYPTIFPKFHLADELIPDFMMVGHRSGASWDVDLIEIEPAFLGEPLFNKQSQPKRRFRDALEQVAQWQVWMGEYKDFFIKRALARIKESHAWDKSLFFNKATSLDVQVLTSYRIIIGRRQDFEDFDGWGYKYRDSMWTNSGRRLEIVPWDRLMDKIRIYMK